MKQRIHDGPTLIRTYEPGDETAILELFRLVFEKEKTLGQWEWEFRVRSPYPYIMLGFHQDRLAAHCAGIPLKVKYGNSSITVLQGVDFMSHPGFRSYRMFVKTARVFFQTFGGSGKGEVPMVFGFPGTRHRILGEKILEYSTLTAVHCLQKELTRKPTGAGRLSRMKGIVETVHRFDEHADRLWDQVRHAYPMALIRDRSYLNWRYASHPRKHYTLLQVVQRWNSRLGAWAVLDQTGDRGLLVDFSPSLDLPWMNRLLLQEVESRLLERAARVAECWCHPKSPASQILLRHGWKVIPQRDDLHLGAIAFDEEIRLDWVRDHFCYTLGDTDIA